MAQDEFADFPIEFYNEVNENKDLYIEAEDRLRKLAKGNTDIVGASITLRKPDAANDTQVEATVTAYTRPEYTVASAVARQPEAALKGALDAVERQVRDKRERLRGY